MYHKKAEQNLINYSKSAYEYAIHKINDSIFHVVGLGHSNATFIIANTSVILIDTLDSDVRSVKLLNEIRKYTDKPVKTIIYTHGHPDHRGGAATFKETVSEIMAGKAKQPPLKYTERLSDVLNERACKQFGYSLTDEEVITQGLGIREGLAVHEGKYAFLDPTTFIENKEIRNIDGVELEIELVGGETDDQLLIYLPKEQVLCCGDNYYACWPNLYAIRGSQYRDVAKWCESLDRLLSYPAQVLLPGHTNPVFGTENIQSVLSHYKNAIESILFQTLDCMNKQMNLSQIIETVKLPKEYSSLPYLQEFYGTIEWSVRSIYTGYLGWFDGDVINLSKLSDNLVAREMIELIDSDEKVFHKICEYMMNEKYLLALNLCELLINANHQVAKAKELKIKVLYGLSKHATSSNARHYYIASAKILENS